MGTCWTKTLAFVGCLAGVPAVWAQAPSAPWGVEPMPVAPSYAPPSAYVPPAPADGAPPPAYGPAPGGYGPDQPTAGPPPLPRDITYAWGGPLPPPPPPNHVRITGEGLVWWMKKAPLATPLVTSTALGADPAVSLGLLNQPGTVVLFGENGLGAPALGGARLKVGIDTDPGAGPGFELSGFWAGQHTNNFAAQSDATGRPLLARPIFAIQPDVNQEVVFFSSFPDEIAGGITVTSSSQIYGGEANVVGNLDAAHGSQLDALLGFRYTGLNERLHIDSSATPVNAGFTVFFNGTGQGVGNTTRVHDEFTTTNDFYGPQIGGRWEYERFGWFLSVDAKAGAGVTVQTLNIHGDSTLVAADGTTTTTNGGILAVPSNSGHFVHERFTYVPEGTLTIGYDISPALRVSLGYNVTYWSSVIRPGDQVNRFVDTRQIPTDQAFNPAVTPLGPAAPFQRTDFWIQGLNASVAFAW